MSTLNRLSIDTRVALISLKRAILDATETHLTACAASMVESPGRGVVGQTEKQKIANGINEALKGSIGRATLRYLDGFAGRIDTTAVYDACDVIQAATRLADEGLATAFPWTM
jgi:hypothetical protein